MTIGFVGTGLMGSRMAANLMDAGHDLVVFNRTPEKMQPLVERGAQPADSPADAAARTEIVITMVSTPEAVEAVALGEDGVLAGAEAGALWVDCSTVNPSFSRRMASAASEHDVRFVDAPVAGTTGPAEEGTLLFLVGGSEEDVTTCRPLFEAMGRDAVHVGGHGQGTALKMVVNMLLGVNMAAFAEAVRLGEGLDIDRELLLNVLPGAPVVAPFVQAKREKLRDGDYAPEFPLRWMLKDLHLAALSAYEAGVPLPVEQATKESFAAAARDGYADLDFSAIYAALGRDDGA